MKQKSIIEIIDEREEYHLVENRFDLNILLDKVIESYSFMNKENLISIRWSNKCIKQWFGLCQKLPNDQGQEEL